MKRYAPVGVILLVTGLIFMTPTGFSQTTSPELDLGIKVINPSALGLDSTASAQAGTGLSFTLGSAGGREIPVEIITEEVSVNSQAKLESFLSEHGIRPDANAQSFVYYLNPDLPSIREIGKGTKLQLPIFRAPTIDRELPRQPIIAVVIDPKLKNGLHESVNIYRQSVKKKRKDFVPQVVNDLTSISLNLDLKVRAKQNLEGERKRMCGELPSEVNHGRGKARNSKRCAGKDECRKCPGRHRAVFP